MVFGRNINGETFAFGVSGLLRQSNLIMWDRQTESWWQQGTAKAVLGEMTGTKLRLLSFQIVSFRDFSLAFPQGTVLKGPGSTYNYNPYQGYDTSHKLFADSRLRATERIIGLGSGDTARAYPFNELAEARVVSDTHNNEPIVIFYEPSTISTLDAGKISESRPVGAASVLVPRLGDLELDFDYRDGVFVDSDTGSTWNILGIAVDGPLKGQRLPNRFHSESLWFYWAAINPETTIYESVQCNTRNRF